MRHTWSSHGTEHALEVKGDVIVYSRADRYGTGCVMSTADDTWTPANLPEGALVWFAALVRVAIDRAESVPRGSLRARG